mmetsp:Transcript_65202/g.147060  ORF Transcript_65202/g.147060 Transcript_65202/m.147060 type:complete len:120 (-) Transcript_65202:35-394(-)
MRVAHSNTRLLSPPFFGGACVLPCCTGDGVVGLHPVLREGGFRPDRQRGHGGGGGYVSLTTMGWTPGVFRYQSCSGASRPGGSFGGTLRLVPGTLENPVGEAFEVEVARFGLDLPDFTF